MARPTKTGLSYFPHDTDAIHDPKIKLLCVEHGAAGYAAYFILLEMIYRSSKGELDLSQKNMFKLVAETCFLSEENLNLVIKSCYELDLFCQLRFHNHKILGSAAIDSRIKEVSQKRLKDAKRQRKKRENCPRDNPRDNGVTSPDNSATTRQRKGKETKGKEKKGKEKKEGSASPLDVFDFNLTCPTWLDQSCVNVSPDPCTTPIWMLPQKAKRLQTLFDRGRFDFVVSRMETWFANDLGAYRKKKDFAATFENMVSRMRDKEGRHLHVHPVLGAGFYSLYEISKFQSVGVTQ